MKKPSGMTDNLWRLIQITDFTEEEEELWIQCFGNMNDEQKKRFESILQNNEILCSPYTARKLTERLLKTEKNSEIKRVLEFILHNSKN